MTEEICKGCEWNSGKQCNQNPTGEYNPYNNCCHEVLELAEELKAWKATSKQDAYEKHEAEEAAIKLYGELKEAKKLIREIEKHFQNGFAQTKEGSKCVHDQIKKYQDQTIGASND